MFSLDIEYYIFSIVILYIPFHLFEEAIGNFPLWMKEHGYTPVKKSYGFWMAGNIFFFYPLLLASALVSFFAGEKCIAAGLAVFMWGGINFFEHLFFTLKDKKVAAGLYTSVLFIAVSVIGIQKVYQMGLITPISIILSIIIALISFTLPALLQKYVGNTLWKNFN